MSHMGYGARKWGTVHAKAEGQGFVVPFQDQPIGFWDDCWERRLWPDSREPTRKVQSNPGTRLL